MDNINPSKTESFFDPFAPEALFSAQPTPDPEESVGAIVANAESSAPETVPETVTDAPHILPDYSESQHRIQLSDQLHVDIPDETLSDAQAHLWKNGFPNMNQTDTIAALLRSGVVTQGVPVEGANAFYQEHGVIPNARAADTLRSYFQGAPGTAADSNVGSSPADEASAQVSKPVTTADPSASLRDQHDLNKDAPNPGDLMQMLTKSVLTPETKIKTAQNTSPPDVSSANGVGSANDTAPPKPADTGITQKSAPGGGGPAGDKSPAGGGGRGFALPSFGLPAMASGLRSFTESRAEHSIARRAANLENTRLDMAMDSARDALKGIDTYLPSSGIPEGDRALVYADRLKKDPEAHAAHYNMIGKFSRLHDTVEHWTDVAKDNPALQKEADKKLKAVDDLLKSGGVVPDTAFKESLEKITKAISEMFSRIFQKLGFAPGASGKSVEAGL